MLIVRPAKSETVLDWPVRPGVLEYMPDAAERLVALGAHKTALAFYHLSCGEDVPVMLAGAYPAPHEDWFEVWTWPTVAMPQHVRPLVRTGRRYLGVARGVFGMQRLVAHVKCGWPEALRFAQLFGFELIEGSAVEYPAIGMMDRLEWKGDRHGGVD